MTQQQQQELLESASDLAHFPGVQNEETVKKFLDRFPLPLVIDALQRGSDDIPGFESTLIACLERVFGTKYGASLIPQYMPFVQAGLMADSQAVRSLACKTVSCLLESFDERRETVAQLITDYNVYPHLLSCLIKGDEQVAAASTDAIKKIAGFPEGLGIIFPADNNSATHLGKVVDQCSSLGRVRVLSLMVKLFSVSTEAASLVYHSNLLGLLESEVRNTNDTLVTLSILEILYELAEVEHGTEFLSKTTLLQFLASVVSNDSASSILRARAMMISGRLLSRENIYKFIDKDSVQAVIYAIDRRLNLFEFQDTDECESALEALGHIGSSKQGAILLLSSYPPTARHVIDAAFNRHGHGRQLAALHALANISGETRSEDNVKLTADAEEALRRLIYETASKSTKLTPSGLFLSLLQQDFEVRLAGYRVISALAARSWCLMEIFSKQDIINIVTDPTTETVKLGMEARHLCCKAIYIALSSSSSVKSDPNLAGLASKIQEAVGRGPYVGRKHPETQPAVMTEQRF